ncbi:MAG TPA: GumC family protein, partial [Pyrinomonadaceae bacterium]|nr:GumC family protein [Pyrinomonadaceae bacterium]
MKNLIGPVSKRTRTTIMSQHPEGLSADPQPLNRYFAAGGVADEGPQLIDLWHSIRRHMVLVISLTIFITTGVAVYLAFKPNVYEAEAQVQVNLENISPQLGGVKGGSLIVNPVNDPAYFNTQLQLLVRPWLLRRVVKTLDIEHNAMFAPQDRANSGLRGLLGRLGFNSNNNPAIDESALAGPAQGSMSAEELAEAARLAPFVEALQTGLAVDPVKETRLPIKETRLINISFTHTDAQIATRIVNTLADTYVRSNLENKNDLNAMTRDILQKRITELQTETRASEQKLMDYAKANEILSLDPSQNTVVERLAGLNRQLLEAENERKLAEATYREALAPGAAEALAESETARDAAESNNRLAELRQRRAQLLVESTEEWPEVKEIDQQIAVLEKHVSKNRERAGLVMVKNLETKYRQSLAREQSLRAAFNQQRGETLKQNEAAIYYRMMQQEVETGSQLLDGLLQRQKENDGQLAGMLNNVRVNDYAVVPKVPIGPKRMLYTTVAFVFSLAFSLGLAILTDYMDNTMRSAEDVEKTLQTRTLASIPAVGIADRSRLLQLPGALSIRSAFENRMLQLPAVLPKRDG